jgi:hypothetical protein
MLRQLPVARVHGFRHGADQDHFIGVKRHLASFEFEHRVLTIPRPAERASPGCARRDNMAHMVEHLTPLSPAYNDTLQLITRTLMDMGETQSQAMTAGTSQIFQTYISQATILAYLDIFTSCALFSLCFVPLAIFLSPAKSSDGRGH